jgi:hypothetical protein
MFGFFDDIGKPVRDRFDRPEGFVRRTSGIAVLSSGGSHRVMMPELLQDPSEVIVRASALSLSPGNTIGGFGGQGIGTRTRKVTLRA